MARGTRLQRRRSVLRCGPVANGPFRDRQVYRGPGSVAHPLIVELTSHNEGLVDDARSVQPRSTAWVDRETKLVAPCKAK